MIFILFQRKCRRSNERPERRRGRPAIGEWRGGVPLGTGWPLAPRPKSRAESRIDAEFASAPRSYDARPIALSLSHGGNTTVVAERMETTMSLFDISRAAAVYNALEAVKDSRARDARTRHAHQQQDRPSPAAAATDRSGWRAKAMKIRSRFFG